MQAWISINCWPRSAHTSPVAKTWRSRARSSRSKLGACQVKLLSWWTQPWPVPDESYAFDAAFVHVPPRPDSVGAAGVTLVVLSE